MTETPDDPELKAIQAIIDALNPLEPEAQQRVADYVSRRMNLTLNIPLGARSAKLPSDPGSSEPSQLRQQFVDIRSLRDQKKPSSANEMAALVAFYLAEFAPADDRKTTIDKSDVEKYFKQAGFPLPKVSSQTLINAARAGYFDTTGAGRYRLNPVGYNLVVHGLPAKGKAST